MKTPDSKTPMMRQYDEMKSRYPGFILFFRLGDFYEMFDDDAEEAAGILGIALTRRAGQRMCGIPYHAKDNYLFKLIKANKKVAICEQVEEPGKNKIVRREVTELVTPGTFTDEKHLAGHRHSYLAALTLEGGEMAVSFADASTGRLVLCREPDLPERLASLLNRFQPSEILCAKIPESAKGLLERFFVTEIPGYYFSPAMNEVMLLEHFQVGSLKGIGLSDPLLAGSCGAALRYLRDNLFQEIRHLKEFEILRPESFVYLPESTLRNLEILEPLFQSGEDSSLFHCFHHTKTPMGSRELRQWLVNPLFTRPAIEDRLFKVESLMRAPSALSEIRNRLAGIPDLERILSKISLGKAGPRDLAHFRSGLKNLESVKDVSFSWNPFTLPPVLNEVVNELERVLEEEPPVDFEEGGVIRCGINPELDHCKTLSFRGKELLLEIERREKEATGISSLKLRYNKVVGYYIEVSKSNLKSVPAHYIRKQSLVGAERFTLDELIAYESEILEAKDRVKTFEIQEFQKLVAWILEHLETLRRNLDFIKTLDVLACFAHLARERNYRKPEMTESGEILIEDGRHPVVESFVDEFITNSVTLDEKETRLLLITGPNMAGKSTFLRQTALITLLAHAGSFVPAKKAVISLTDQIFTRVGASDNLAGGESTFLVEMSETSQILRHATEKSLIIMDEVGRGTATYDGLSLAWAIVEYLAGPEKPRGKTLFATHYHELTVLGQETGIENYRMAVREWNQEIVFLHRVEKGAADKSYGIHVAEIAGIPKPVINRAKEILSGMEISLLSNEPRLLKPHEPPKEESLFALPEDPFAKARSQILSLDIQQTTPMQALLILEQLQSELKKKK